jgi:hypothetical protein
MTNFFVLFEINPSIGTGEGKVVRVDRFVGAWSRRFPFESKHSSPDKHRTLLLLGCLSGQSCRIFEAFKL